MLDVFFHSLVQAEDGLTRAGIPSNHETDERVLST